MSRGHETQRFERSSLDIGNGALDKAKALFSGVYNLKSRREIRAWLQSIRPDIAFVQNLYPLISPSVLPVFTELEIPVVMRCPNYRLVCPNGLFMAKGEICHRCEGGREYWCLLNNCEESLMKSMGYALRGYLSRTAGFFRKHVDCFMVLTEFAKSILVRNGYPKERIQVISGIANRDSLEDSEALATGDYVGYLGRISREKGVETLLKAAHQLPHIPFKVAGGFAPNYSPGVDPPENVEFVGHLKRFQVKNFYARARMIVVPSTCYEGLASVILEAMLNRKPVICSRLGGLPEVVEDKKTGLLFKHDSTEDLVSAIAFIWKDQNLCREFGKAGYEKALSEYSEEAFYQRLLSAFNTAIGLKRKTVSIHRNVS
jgi:glycosyltransferase involved in cell wall biosynthesis